MPRSAIGRLLGVLMVVSSLFIVSIFVANITAALTVDAITGSIQTVDDLNGRKVATTAGSTASRLLTDNSIPHLTLETFTDLIEAFETGEIEAVVFDGPILAYYVKTKGQGRARLIGRQFRRENYGIALPEGSLLREPLNRAILRLKETGDYQTLVARWFGARD